MAGRRPRFQQWRDERRERRALACARPLVEEVLPIPRGGFADVHATLDDHVWLRSLGPGDLYVVRDSGPTLLLKRGPREDLLIGEDVRVCDTGMGESSVHVTRWPEGQAA